MTILTRNQLLEGLAAHLATHLAIDPANADEVAGAATIAAAAADYFADSFRGSPPGSGRALLWAVYSALWEGKVRQEELDAFFGEVDFDCGRLFDAWRQVRAGNLGGPMTVALIPGNLSEADILDVVKALYAQRRGASA